ncbi:MAG: glycoside hydrolase family 2 TIM barrel-domain containing protein [Bacteroidota bacterium]
MRVLSLLVFLLAIHSCQSDLAQQKMEPITENITVTGVAQAVISLNGTWRVNTAPENEFWTENSPTGDWQDIKVPGELMMQGIALKHDEPFGYLTRFKVPADYAEQQIIIRFEGVYSYARVWVNGEYVRDHTGGFTAWDCDITSFVEAGKMATLAVEVTDKADEVSYASGYAAHPIGGILRNVTLRALPQNYPSDVTISTSFDDNYVNATLSVSGSLDRTAATGRLDIELLDPAGEAITLTNNTLDLSNKQDFVLTNAISQPEQWDAEHPNLYQLKISYAADEEVIYEKVYPVGFREVVVSGNELLVNGKPVKLRGANRHDIHPTLGRVSTPEFELLDVQLAKEANLNFIRTSHYPPSENFLSLCDQYGLYVEDETAVCFVGSHRANEYYPGSSENDPAFTDRYLSQLKEMVKQHKNHPSIIIWSIGNENSFGNNFKLSYDWVKEYDPSRPIIFSYPGHVPDSVKSYDILSMHYPEISGNLDQFGKVTESFGYEPIPALFDEWAHVPCYNNFTVIEDPNVRDLWGISLDSMWRTTFDASGGLGGAIWCMIDETFFLPMDLPGYGEWWGRLDQRVLPTTYTGHTIGYGEWGIVDAWRRKKPEFWNTKKALSPIRILNTTFDYVAGQTNLTVPVYNRFDHTNLRELTLKMTKGDATEAVIPTDIPPHAKGELRIPISDWDATEKIALAFYDQNDRLIDKYQLSQTQSSVEEDKNNEEGRVSLERSSTQLVVKCDNGKHFVFATATGQLTAIEKAGKTTSIAGPMLNLRTLGKQIKYSNHEINEYANGWTLQSFNAKESSSGVTIATTGSYADIGTVSFQISITPSGKMSIQYSVDSIPAELIREIGIKFMLADAFDAISWQRETFWSCYPEDHLSAEQGRAELYTSAPKSYGDKPEKEWNKDNKSFYYSGTDDEVSRQQLTHIARSTKEKVYRYGLQKGQNDWLNVLGEGQLNCRLIKIEEELQLAISNEIDYPDMAWGNYQRNIRLDAPYRNAVTVQF